MKSTGLLNRALKSMTLPVFAAASAGLVSVVLFGFCLAAVFAYRFQHSGTLNPPDGVPNIVLLIAGLVCVALSAAVSYAVGRKFQMALDAFSSYLLHTDTNDAPPLEQVVFAELRRLRADTTRTVFRLKRENARLRELAFVDRRTGLGTVALLDSKLAEALPQARFETPAAYFLLNLDNFGRIADENGTARAEALLILAAGRMKKALNTLDENTAPAASGAVLVHFHTDEFALFLPNAISRDHVSSVARSIRLAFQAPFDLNGSLVNLGISGGIVMLPEDAGSDLRLHAHAKLALKQARQDSGSGFRFFSPNLDRVVRGRYQLEAELREAVRNREFKPVFQPKVDLNSGRIIGAEALARWRRSNGKVISPAAFITVAEETGLILQIGEQILEAACAAAFEWTCEGHEMTVAVNVSPRQFQRADLHDVVLRVLSDTGLPPRLLELEITESMAVSDPAKVADVMRPLRALGVKLAIDDFGTGHSNLSTLTQLPFDVFKIDRQFVSGLETDRQAPAIVEMILAMAETLGLKTVAEGVETPRQADFLRRRGCTIGQGFLYSPGLAPGAFMELVRAWHPVSAAPVSQTLKR